MEEKYSVQTALRWIVQQYSRDIFQQELMVNSMLADLAKDQESERKKIRLAMSSGAGKMFYKILLQTDGNLQSQDVSKFRLTLAESGFTDEFVNYVVNTFLFSVSVEQSEEDTNNGLTQETDQADGAITNLPLEKILEYASGYENTQDYNREIYLLESVLDKYPDCPGIYNMLGIAYRNINDYPQALRYYEKALKIEPENGIYLMNKAIAKMMSGMVKEARVSFEKAIPILQKSNGQMYAKALGNYSYALALDGETAEAVKTLKNAAQLGYQNAEGMRRMLEKLGIYYH